MSFTAANLLDYYKASMAGKVSPNMQYVSQRGRGMGNKRRRLIYNINQKGAGTNLVSPIAQDFQQAKSMIKHRNSIKRGRSRSTSSHPKRRRTVRKSSKRSTRKTTSTKKKRRPQKKGRKKTAVKKRVPKKKGKKKITKKDIFGK